MAEIRAAHSAFALTITGPSLFDRIRRLLGQDSPSERKSSWLPSVMAILLLISIIIPAVITLGSNEKTNIDEDKDQSDWQKTFYSVYRLNEGEILKRIAPPFIPQRKDYYEHEHTSQALAIPEPPDYFTFHWDGKLKNWGLGFMGQVHNLDAVLRHNLIIGADQFEGQDELLQIEMPGDWIVRSDATQAEMLKALEKILKNEIGREIHFIKREVERPVIIASGNYEFHPLSGTYDDSQINFYSDTLDPDEGSGGGPADSLSDIFDVLAKRTGLQVIDNSQPGDFKSIGYGHHRSSGLTRIKDPTEKEKKLQLLLDNLARQTNLSFKIEIQPVEKWFVVEGNEEADLSIEPFQKMMGSPVGQIQRSVIPSKTEPFVPQILTTSYIVALPADAPLLREIISTDSEVILNPDELAEILASIQTIPQARLLAAPKILANDGETVSVKTENAENFGSIDLEIKNTIQPNQKAIWMDLTFSCSTGQPGVSDSAAASISATSPSVPTVATASTASGTSASVSAAVSGGPIRSGNTLVAPALTFPFTPSATYLNGQVIIVLVKPEIVEKLSSETSLLKTEDSAGDIGPEITTKDTSNGEKAFYSAYPVNRSVSDFPETEDFSTPESAYAAINRVIARDDPEGWQRVSVKSLAERFAQEPQKKSNITPEWSDVVLHAKILKVSIQDNQAVVLAEFPQDRISTPINLPANLPIDFPVDSRRFTLEDGKWLNMRENVPKFPQILTSGYLLMVPSDWPQRQKITFPIITPEKLGELLEMTKTVSEARLLSSPKIFANNAEPTTMEIKDINGFNAVKLNVKNIFQPENNNIRTNLDFQYTVGTDTAAISTEVVVPSGHAIAVAGTTPVNGQTIIVLVKPEIVKKPLPETGILQSENNYSEIDEMDSTNSRPDLDPNFDIAQPYKAIAGNDSQFCKDFEEARNADLKNSDGSAIEKYQQFMDKYPDSPANVHLLNLMSAVYLRSNQYDQAREALQQAIQIAGEDRFVNTLEINLANVEMNAGDLATAETRLKRVMAVPVPETLEDPYAVTPQLFTAPFFLAEVYQEKGDTEKADNLLKQAADRALQMTQENPDKKWLPSYVGGAYQRRINFLLETQPENIDAAYALAEELTEKLPHYTGMFDYNMIISGIRNYQNRKIVNENEK